MTDLTRRSAILAAGAFAAAPALAAAQGARLRVAASMADLADCDLVVEAVVEDLGVKRAIFKELEAVVGPTATLATNTSSLSVTAIAAGLAHPERIAGFHFFNPVPLMKVVEVVVRRELVRVVALNIFKDWRAQVRGSRICPTNKTSVQLRDALSEDGRSLGAWRQRC